MFVTATTLIATKSPSITLLESSKIKMVLELGVQGLNKHSLGEQFSNVALATQKCFHQGERLRVAIKSFLQPW